MRRYKPFALPTVLWLLAVLFAAGVTAQNHRGERERLYQRFELRSVTGASFVGAYVDDVFKTEERLARRMSSASWSPTDFAASAQFLGFPVGVLLDHQGRAVALSPDAPQMRGTQLAARYPHLAAALEGRRTVSDVVASAVAKRPIVAFALPLTDQRFGVVSGGFSLSASPLKAFLQRQPIAGTRGYVLDSRGAVIVSAGPGAGTLAPAHLTTALRGVTVSNGRLLRAVSIPGTRWSYVLDSPDSVLLAPVAASDRSQWALLAVLAALSLVGVLLAGRAMAARTQARTEKELSDHRLRMTVQNAPIGMTMVDLDYKFVEPNDRLCSMLAYSAEELGSMTFEEVTHADDVELDKAFVHQLLAGEIDHYELEKRYVRSDGTLLLGRLAVSLVRGEDSKPLYFVSQIEDVTEFRAAQAELEYRALYDPFTGLANRGLLMDRLTSTLADTRHPVTIGVAFCDVDHFKQINDVHGHHAGDEVLKEIARRLSSAVRTADTVARMGGDEFIILLSEVSSRSEAELVVQRATRAVNEPMFVDNETFMVGLSVGLALGEVGGSSDTLLGDADVALYAAKEGSRGRCVVYDPALRETAVVAPVRGEGEPSAAVGTGPSSLGSIRMDELIRHALDHDTIAVAYQPVFDLNSGALVATEALLRLHDPAGRPVLPRHVIPAAESSGLIIELGRRVLHLAARQSAAWHQQHGILIPVAVNVSAAQLGLEDFPQEVLNAVHDAGVPTRGIMLELTESVLLQTGSAGIEQLSALQQAGIELAIDDFGTGYASLSLLHELPAATLKIDQSFVAGIPHDERATTIVAGVIALAKNFGMSCIAEGIENERQRTYLAERGVLGQGFLLGIPDDSAVIGRLIAARGSAPRPPSVGSAALEHPHTWGHHGAESVLLLGLPRVSAVSSTTAPGSYSPMEPIAGVYAHEAGLTELTREMARAKRTAESLMLAVVTLDDLKATDQRSGTGAEHRLLREVAAVLKLAVRPYDLVISYSDDQFVCAVAGLSFTEWECRLRLVDADIRERSPHASVHIGLAQMRADDSGRSLIAKANSASETFHVTT